MLRLMILGFQIAAFATIVLLASQIPVKTDIKGRVTKVSDYVAELTSKEMIQGPIRWAGSKFDFIAGHGQKKIASKNARIDGAEHDIMERAELSGLLKGSGSKSLRSRLYREDKDENDSD